MSRFSTYSGSFYALVDVQTRVVDTGDNVGVVDTITVQTGAEVGADGVGAVAVGSADGLLSVFKYIHNRSKPRALVHIDAGVGQAGRQGFVGRYVADFARAAEGSDVVVAESVRATHAFLQTLIDVLTWVFEMEEELKANVTSACIASDGIGAFAVWATDWFLALDDIDARVGNGKFERSVGGLISSHAFAGVPSTNVRTNGEGAADSWGHFALINVCTAVGLWRRLGFRQQFIPRKTDASSFRIALG